MIATKRHLRRRAIMAARKLRWKDYSAYKAQCRQANVAPMKFDDWKAPQKETHQ